MTPRRRLIVEGFQIQWIVSLLVWMLVVFAAFALLLLGPPVWRLMLSEAGAADLEDAATTLLTLNERIWLPLAGLFLALALVVVKLTHLVAGPLFRFRRVFDAVGRGDLSLSARIRPGDYLQAESRALQAMLDGLRDRITQAERAVVTVADEVDGLARTGRSVSAHEIAGLKVRAEVAREAFAVFVTVGPDETPAQSAASARAVPDAGFSLVELLLVLCITTTVTAIAVPAYSGALYRARVTRAMGDLNAFGKDIMMHRISQGCFPATLADIQRASARDPWGRPYEYAVPEAPGGGGGGGRGGRGGGGGGGGRGSCEACGGACVPPGQARKDHNLVPINSDFDLYSLGRDGASSGPLTASHSKDDVIRGRSGAFVGLASEY